MIQALIERDMQWSLLLEKLMQQTHAEEEKRGDPVFLFQLASTLTAYLQQRIHNAPLHDKQEREDFFWPVIFPKIQEFGRSQTEEDALVADFWDMVVQAAVVLFSERLQKEESSR